MAGETTITIVGNLTADIVHFNEDKRFVIHSTDIIDHVSVIGRRHQIISECHYLPHRHFSNVYNLECRIIHTSTTRNVYTNSVRSTFLWSFVLVHPVI